MTADDFIQAGKLKAVRLGIKDILAMERDVAIQLTTAVLSIADSHQWQLRDLPPDAERSVRARELYRNAGYLSRLADGRMSAQQVDDALAIDDAADEFIREGRLDNFKKGIEFIQTLDKDSAIALMTRVQSFAQANEQQLRIHSKDSQSISDAKDIRKSAEYLLLVADGTVEPTNYYDEQIKRLNSEDGTAPAAFNMQITSANGKTNWLAITPNQLDKILNVLNGTVELSLGKSPVAGKRKNSGPSM